MGTEIFQKDLSGGKAPEDLIKLLRRKGIPHFRAKRERRNAQ